MINVRKERGITLIALVITIIILIILAMVSINAIIGEGGLITNSEKSADEYKREKGMEQIQLVLGDDTIERSITGDDLTVSRLVDLFNTKEWVVKAYAIEENEQGDGKLRIINDEGYVYDLIIEGGKVRIEYVGENTGPIINEINVLNKDKTSIEIEVEAINVDGGKYTYYYKKDGETEYIKAGESESNTYKYEGLEANVIYNIKVEVKANGDKAEKEINVLTGELPEGTITFEETIWSEGKASVVVNTSEEGYILQYQIGGTEGEWIEIPTGGTIEGLKYAETVYARLWDGTTGTVPASVTIEDKIDPEVSIEVVGVKSNSITITAVAKDGESGLATEETYKYYLEDTIKETSTTNSYKYEGLEDGVDHNIKVTVKDEAGNETTETITQGTATVPSGLIQGIITFGDQIWSNEKASVTVETSQTEYTIQYQVGGIEEGKWTEIENGGTIGELNHNDTVYARLWDGVNGAEPASVDIKDETKPTASAQLGSQTPNSIQVVVTANDGESGLATEGRYTYYIKQSTATTYEQKASITTANYTFNGLAPSTSYDIKIDVKDKAGNTTTVELTNITTKETVARIDQVYYETLQKAIDAVPTTNTQTTVVLLKTVSENVDVIANKNIILDLNSYNLSNATADYVINNNGTLEITNASTISSTASYATIFNQNTGSLTIQSGSITSSNYYGITNSGVLELGGTVSINTTGLGLYNTSTGNATIAGGTITSSANNTINNYGILKIDGTANITNNATYSTIVNNNNLTIAGGTINSPNDMTIYNLESANTTITGGTITSDIGNAVYNSGILEISGTANLKNTNTEESPAIYNTATGNITITGGTVSSELCISIYNLASGTVTMTGGTVTGKVYDAIYNSNGGELTVSGGTISSGSGYDVIYNLGIAQISETAKITATGAASVYNGSTGTATMTGGTITGCFANYGGNATITGGTITDATWYGLSNTGIVTIGGTAKIHSSSTEYPTIANDTTGDLTVSGGAITSTSVNAISNYGTLKINGTASVSTDASGYPIIYNEASANLTITGGTVSTVNSVGIYNSSGGNLTVTGGTISSTNSNAINNYGVLEISGTAQITNQSSTYPIIYNNGTGSITIAGGTISSANSVCIYNSSGGGLTITGGTISSTNSNAVYNAGVLKISGTAQITNQANSLPTVVNQNTGNMTITGGTITNNAGGYAAYNNGGTASVTGGTISSRYNC